MKSNKGIFLTLILVALIVVSYLFYNYYDSSDSSSKPFLSENEIKDNQKQSSLRETIEDNQNSGGLEPNFIELQPQANDEAGVSVEVSADKFDLINPSFKITFTTHQGDLNFDITKISVLIDDQGRQYSPLNWDGGSGGHHLAGNLIFPAIDKNTKTIKLILKDIYGIEEREFLWNLE